MLSPLQKRLLDMLQWFHELCVENGLKYYIAYGTMLGAVRHNGFIPWDDDIDVVVPRPDYDKLCQLIGDKKVEKYYLETVKSDRTDYLYGYAKLYDTTTTMIEHTRKDVVRGIFIDVFPLDGVGNTEKECFHNYKRIDRANMFLATRICAIRKDRSLMKNIAVLCSRLIPSLFVNEKKLLVNLDKMCAKNGFDKKFVANCMSTYRTKDIMDIEIFGTPTIYNFENIEVYGPEQYNAYLTHLYHDWKKLPPADKQHAAHDFYDLDLEKPYME